MNHKTTLGNKLLFFRKRAGLSQFDLEMAIGASPGSISRIESNSTNPTKETLAKIDDVLKLTNLEKEYLHGRNAEPATEEEIEAAREEVRELMEERGVVAYLIDDRGRFIQVSNSLSKMFGYSDKDLEEVLGKTLVEVAINPKYKVNPLLRNEHYGEVIFNLLERFYIEVSFMADDKYIKEAIEVIKGNNFENEIWETIKRNNPKTLSTNEKRKVYFNFLGRNVPFIYNTTYLVQNPRFELIEYVPDNKIIRLISKLIS